MKITLPQKTNGNYMTLFLSKYRYFLLVDPNIIIG